MRIHVFDTFLFQLEPVFWCMSISNCCFLTCMQVSQEVDKVVWYSQLLKNFPQFVVIHTVKGFSGVNEANVFLEFCFFYDPMDIGNLTFGFSAFLKSSLNIWNFSVHVLLKPSLKDFEHYLSRMWNELNCVVIWTFFGIALLRDLKAQVLVLIPFFAQVDINRRWLSLGLCSSLSDYKSHVLNHCIHCL